MEHIRKQHLARLWIASACWLVGFAVLSAVLYALHTAILEVIVAGCGLLCTVGFFCTKHAIDRKTKDALRLVDWEDSERDVIRAALRRRTLCFGGGAILLCGICLSLLLLSQMLGYTRHSRLESLNADAHKLGTTVATVQSDMAEDGTPMQLETVVYQAGDAIPEGSWLAGVQRYCPDAFSHHFALICDDSGNLCYTLFSYAPTTESELGVPDRDTQMELLASLFTRAEAIGYWSMQSAS